MGWNYTESGKLPELREEVLIKGENGRYFIGYIDGTVNAYTGEKDLHWFITAGIRKVAYSFPGKVVKWMRLPE